MFTPRPTNQHEATRRIEPMQLSAKEIERYSLSRAIKAAAEGNWWAAGFERELTLELLKREGDSDDSAHRIKVPAGVLVENRALQAGVASGGGYLAGDFTVTGVVDALRDAMVCTRAGAQSLTGLTSNTSYARQAGTATVTWQPLESTQAAETTDYALGRIVLAPKTATAYIEVSRLTQLMAADLADRVIRRDLRRTLGAAIDAAALNGSGVSGVPLGLLNTSGIGTFTGAALAYADLLEAQTNVLSANALSEGGEVSFVCRPAVASLLASRQGFSTVAPMWMGPLASGQLVGCPAFSSMRVPAATLIGGDFGQMLIAEWGAGLEIKVNPVAVFNAGIIGVGAYLSTDVALLVPAGFSVATSVS